MWSKKRVKYPKNFLLADCGFSDNGVFPLVFFADNPENNLFFPNPGV